MHCRRLLMSSLLAAMTAVGCGSVSSVPDGSAGAGGGAAGASGGSGGASGGSGGAIGGSGGNNAVCSFATTYTIRDGGGLAAMADTVRLSPPMSFSLERMFFTGDAGLLQCYPPMPDCNSPDRVDVSDVEAAIAHADVQAALALATPPTYGNRAVADGPNFNFMRSGGRGFNAGLACSVPSATCTPIPPGVSALVELLRMLIRQQRMDPACSAIG